MTVQRRYAGGERPATRYIAPMTHAPEHRDNEAPLRAVVERLRAVGPVEQVILFGSRARGDHHEHSDWDVCVLLSDTIAAGVYTPSRMWHAVRDLDETVEVVPMRRSVFEAKRSDVNALAHDVARDGIVLYDASAPLLR
jgi:predicted nucleotidyltransferase